MGAVPCSSPPSSSTASAAPSTSASCTSLRLPSLGSMPLLTRRLVVEWVPLALVAVPLSELGFDGPSGHLYRVGPLLVAREDGELPPEPPNLGNYGRVRTMGAIQADLEHPVE